MPTSDRKFAGAILVDRDGLTKIEGDSVEDLHKKISEDTSRESFGDSPFGVYRLVNEVTIAQKYVVEAASATKAKKGKKAKRGGRQKGSKNKPKEGTAAVEPKASKSKKGVDAFGEE